MLNFFFTVPSEFAVPPTVQAINDIFFPIVLFVSIFTVLCNVFIDSPQQKVIVDIDESVATNGESNECPLEQYLEEATVIEEHQRSLTSKSVELFDVEQERNRLCRFGVRKLRAYCKQHRLKGYSIPAKSGIDAIAEFMLQHQVYARGVEGFDFNGSNVA